MDEPHMLNAVRYLAFNPVRARLRAARDEWEWSSVRAHPGRRDDALVKVRSFWRSSDALAICWTCRRASRRNSTISDRPFESPGGPAFLAFAERKLGRSPARESLAQSRERRVIEIGNCVSCPRSPGRLAHQMQQRLMFRRDASGRHDRRHRLNALALAWRQKTRAIISQRPRSIVTTKNFRYRIDILRKTRFTRSLLMLHLRRHSPFSRISKIANPGTA
jgi:hypothetical protein